MRSVNQQRRSPTGARGFTLIEVMIVVVIIAILAAIAVPIYQTQIMESRRTTAKTALFDLASREEKYFSTNNIYTADMTALGYSNATEITLPNGNAATDFYQVGVSLTTNAAGVQGYLATATAINTQAANDKACANYSLSDLGVQTNSGTQSTGCW